MPVEQKPPNKKRKVSLGGLLGKVKKEKEQEKTPEKDERSSTTRSSTGGR